HDIACHSSFTGFKPPRKPCAFYCEPLFRPRTESRALLFPVQAPFQASNCIENASISSPSHFSGLELHRERFYFKSKLLFRPRTASRTLLFQLQAPLQASNCNENHYNSTPSNFRRIKSLVCCKFR